MSTLPFLPDLNISFDDVSFFDLQLQLGRLRIDLGLSVASGSRNTDYLCSQNRLKKAGLNLITKEVEPAQHGRRLILRLTPLGVRIKNDLLNELNGLHNHTGDGI